MIQKLAPILILGLIFHSHLSFANRGANRGFCERRIAIQLPGFYDQLNDEGRAQDLELLGDLAYNAGIRYFYLTVPILDVPRILAARYLPDFKDSHANPRTAKNTELKPISRAFFGEILGMGISSLNINFVKAPKIEADRTLFDPAKGTPHRILPNPNHNAMILYSPRILALGNWYFGNISMLMPPKDGVVQALYHRAHNCISSSTPANLIDAHLKHVEASQQMGRSKEVLRYDDALPSYEIVGVIVQPENQRMLEAALSRAEELPTWRDRIYSSNTFPGIDPLRIPYIPSHLQAVAEDIDPDMRRNHGDKNLVIVTPPALQYSDSFLDKVLATLTSKIALTDILKPIDPTTNYQGRGISLFQSSNFEGLADIVSTGGNFDGKTIPSLLPGAVVTRHGKFKVQAIRDWTFMVIEYTNKSSEKLIAVFSANGGGKPAADIPHLLWGLGYPNHDESEIRWVWTSKK